MVPVWFTGSQLPPTDMKRSHKVKVTKKDVYLSDDNLADDQENITEQKRKKKQNLLTVSPSSENNYSIINKLNWINPFSAGIFWKTDIKKAEHPTLNGCISKTRTYSESKPNISENKFNFLQNGVYFAHSTPVGPQQGAPHPTTLGAPTSGSQCLKS